MYCTLCRCRKRRLIFPKSEPIPPPLSYVEPFDWTAFFGAICNCLRKCRPYFDNDPPIIMAFGPPDPRDTLKNGQIFTTNGKVPMQNGHSVKMNGNATSPIAYLMPAADDRHGHSPTAYRRELVNEFNKDNKKPNYLRDLEAAWEAAERETGVSKSSSLGSSSSGIGTGVRVEISSPHLENTTFKGETQSLEAAARIQQQRSARSRRIAPDSTTSRHGLQRMPINEPTKPDISAPTLQTSTYKHDLIDLPEAYTTLKNPKRNRKSKPDTNGYSTLQPKR
ncbi:unnamed protein product [Rodentolepis nana]|uniref:Uncharacterized protein n=1 Tax=Rodentolepis nana TaxID=102285 RepID=A0A0R3TG09_RODNA|nr:unnamed protein product [Rodentolepis nana]